MSAVELWEAGVIVVMVLFLALGYYGLSKMQK